MRILISGGGIAGCAAILFLQRGGHDLTVIDKSPAFARRGYILSLKYFGIKIMQALGLWDELRQSGIHFRRFQMHDAKGNLVKEFTEVH
jgi:salicylate hydroxylase